MPSVISEDPEQKEDEIYVSINYGKNKIIKGKCSTSGIADGPGRHHAADSDLSVRMWIMELCGYDDIPYIYSQCHFNTDMDAESVK